MTTILDLRKLLLNAAEELNLPLTERDTTALAHHVAAKAATPRQDRRPLDPRRMDVLLGIAVGETTEETAQRIGRALDTVKSRRVLLFAELGARTAAHAVAIAMSEGLFEARVAADVAWAERVAPLAGGGVR